MIEPRTDATPRKRKRKDPPPTGPREFTDPWVLAGIQYARDVVEGRIPASKFVRAACARHLADLVREDDPAWPYRFDENLAARPCRLISMLPNVKGADYSRALSLMGWQIWILTTVFGYVRKDRPTRRFRRVLIEVPRGNGKSTLTSGVAIYCTFGEGEGGAEGVAAAVTREQSRIVFGDAAQMLRVSPAVAQRLGLEVGAHAIWQEKTGSKFWPVSRDADSLQGLNVHFGAIDECAFHKTRDVIDTVETGTGKRLESLLWLISTAGSNTGGAFFEISRGYVAKMLLDPDPANRDETQFGVIYTIDEDEGDDWTVEESWRKANPGWGITVQPEVVAALARKAMTVASAQASFKQKHLDVWTSADVEWLNPLDFDRCVDPTLRIEDFEGEDCWIGLDLSSRTDLCAKTRTFKRTIDGVDHFFVFLRPYLPTKAIDEPGRSFAPYRGWVKEGWLVECPGETIQFAQVEDEILEDATRFRVRELAFDPWQAEYLSQRIGAALGEKRMVEFRPSVGNFSPAMKEWVALLFDRRIHFPNDPVLRWAFLNVVCHVDARDNVYPRKSRDELKIDPVFSTLTSLARALAWAKNAPATINPYESRGIRTI